MLLHRGRQENGKKLACEVGNESTFGEIVDQVCRRPVLDPADSNIAKKLRVNVGGLENKENYQVIARVQHHQAQ